MARPSATDRLGRILSMVPWIAARDRPRVEEVCERFDITPDELAADLGVVLLVGLYPYTPDSLIEVDIDEEYVSIDYTNFFERPLRLSRDEALSILAAGVTAAAQPGHDPDGALARGVAKVAAVLGVDLGDDLAVVLDPAIAELHRILDQAIASSTVVHLSYFSHARNEHTERDVEPLRLFERDGAWYLDAHCRATAEHRVFRLDRIDAATPTGEDFEPGEIAGEPSSFSPTSDLPTVGLEIDGEDAWLVEQYPTSDVEHLASGRIRCRLVVSARPWLERLLLRLGPTAVVVDGPDDLRTAGADAAARILARYGR